MPVGGATQIRPVWLVAVRRATCPGRAHLISPSSSPPACYILLLFLLLMSLLPPHALAGWSKPNQNIGGWAVDTGTGGVPIKDTANVTEKKYSLFSDFDGIITNKMLNFDIPLKIPAKNTRYIGRLDIVFEIVPCLGPIDLTLQIPNKGVKRNFYDLNIPKFMEMEGNVRKGTEGKFSLEAHNFSQYDKKLYISLLNRHHDINFAMLHLRDTSGSGKRPDPPRLGTVPKLLASRGGQLDTLHINLHENPDVKTGSQQHIVTINTKRDLPYWCSALASIPTLDFQHDIFLLNSPSSVTLNSTDYLFKKVVDRKKINITFSSLLRSLTPDRKSMHYPPLYVNVYRISDNDYKLGSSALSFLLRVPVLRDSAALQPDTLSKPQREARNPKWFAMRPGSNCTCQLMVPMDFGGFDKPIKPDMFVAPKNLRNIYSGGLAVSTWPLIQSSKPENYWRCREKPIHLAGPGSWICNYNNSYRCNFENICQNEVQMLQVSGNGNGRCRNGKAFRCPILSLRIGKRSNYRSHVHFQKNVDNPRGYLRTCRNLTRLLKRRHHRRCVEAVYKAKIITLELTNVARKARSLLFNVSVASSSWFNLEDYKLADMNLHLCVTDVQIRKKRKRNRNRDRKRNKESTGERKKGRRRRRKKLKWKSYRKFMSISRNRWEFCRKRNARKCENTMFLKAVYSFNSAESLENLNKTESCVKLTNPSGIQLTKSMKKKWFCTTKVRNNTKKQQHPTFLMFRLFGSSDSYSLANLLSAKLWFPSSTTYRRFKREFDCSK